MLVEVGVFVFNVFYFNICLVVEFVMVEIIVLVCCLGDCNI